MPLSNGSFPSAEEILDRAKQVADAAEVFYVRTASTPVHFEANTLKGIDSNESVGVALRIVKDGRIGFGSTSDLQDVDGLVRAAVETAPFGAQARFEFPGDAPYPDVPLYDPATDGVRLEAMVQLGRSVVDALRAESNDVQVEGSVSRSTSTISLINDKGCHFTYTRSGMGLGFEGTVIRGEDMLFTHDGKRSCHPVDDAADVVANIKRQLAWARDTAPIETRAMPVIFMPTAVSSVLLSPLLAGFNGRAVFQGTSPLVGRLGELIVDPRVTIVDDPTQSFIPASRPSDDEGVPSRRLPLVDKGMAANFLYDLQTAGLANARSTGSGERGLGSLPSPSASVLMVAEGDLTLEQLLAQIGDGLIVEQLLGAGQSNILGGDFNANVLLGYRVSGGQVVGRVKNTMVSGNAYRALSNLVGVGSEGRWLGGGLYVPPIACADVAVASKG